MPVARKSLGQHWLNDETSLSDICAAAQLTKNDTVLEVGPGTGSLTRVLLKQAGAIISVEKDTRLVTSLRNSFNNPNLRIVADDILHFDLTSLPPDYKVVANIPYYLTSILIRTLSESSNQAKCVVLLVQKEVALRVAAMPGAMSLLSVTAQYFWEVSVGQVVPAKLFTPPPKVDSQILILVRRSRPLFPEIDTKLFFRLVKFGYSSRRKTLLNSLAGGLRTEKQQIENALRSADIAPGLRPQNLTIEQWHALFDVCRAANLL